MGTGYQLIEAPELDGVTGNPKSFDLAVAMLTWLIERLRRDLGEALGHVELCVVRAEYHGAYPALGIRYAAADDEDVSAVVLKAISRLVEESSLTEFISFLSASAVDWRAETDRIMSADGQDPPALVRTDEAL